MTRINAREQQELLDDARSPGRRRDFARLDRRLITLSAGDYLSFLTSASQVSTERKANRPPMAGARFLL